MDPIEWAFVLAFYGIYYFWGNAPVHPEHQTP